MTLENHLSDDDLVLFALQLLPEERMRTASPHIQNCHQCRAEIAKIQGDLAAYSTTAEPQAPPVGSRDRFTRQVAREPRLQELPPFNLQPTESELRQQELRQQEKLTLTPQPEPPQAAPERRNNQPLIDYRQDALQNRYRDNAEDRHEDRRDDRHEDRYETRHEARYEERHEMRHDTRHEERHDDRVSERASDRSEPSLSTRHSRSLSLGSHEDIEPVAPSRPSAEPVFAARHTRTLTRGTRRDDAENVEVYREERRRPGRAPWILAFTGWAVAIGCSFVAGLQLHQRQQVQSTVANQQAKMDDMHQQVAHALKAQTALATLTSANAMQVALHATPAEKPATATKGAPPPIQPEALAAYLADKGALVFVATHLQPAPAGKTYELWLLPSNGQNPMPAGIFKPDPQGSASVVMPHLPSGILAKGFAVTVENEGGSQTPTMPLLMS